MEVAVCIYFKILFSIGLLVVVSFLSLVMHDLIFVGDNYDKWKRKTSTSKKINQYLISFLVISVILSTILLFISKYQ